MLGIALQDMGGKDVEETGICKNSLFEEVLVTVLKRQFLFAELACIACGSLNFGNFPCQHGGNASRCGTKLLRLLAFALECFLQLIHMFFVHDAAVVVSLQLHLGYQHQSDGKSDG